MKILLFLRLYSHFIDSINKKVWSPKGMPAVYKLIDRLNAKGIHTDVIFISYDKSDNINKYQKLKFDKLENINFHIFPYYNNIIKGFTYLKIRHIINSLRLIYINQYNIIYCDRINVEYGGLFARLGYKVFLRLHGVAYLNDTLKPTKKFFVPSIEYFLGYKAPFSAVICSRDGSPGLDFIKRIMKSTIKSKLMLNGVDYIDGLDRVLDLRKKYQLNQKTKIIATIGRLSPDKSPDLFIKSIVEVNKKNKNIFGILIGDGPMKKELQDLINEYGISDKIYLLGTYEHYLVQTFLQQADIFVSLNLCGNLSNAVLEAISAGKCIITLGYDDQTKRDQHSKIEDFKESIIFINHYKIIDDLSTKINQLIENPTLIHKKSNEVKKLNAKYLVSWEKRIDKEIKFINSVIKPT
ncbi:MAG: hypothetical protein CMG74_13205 [Candidatus Marinimicrobia bacterium]|mgnify:CR=1 FL=1|nr:hypothetical protein [Candidatus Neomarinimicrobiota bacterium]